MKKRSFFVLILLTICFFLGEAHTVLATDEVNEIAFMKRYLTISPPVGWKRQPTGSGMYQNCILYASEDEIIGVAACPGFQRNSTFQDVIANVKKMERTTTCKKRVILKKEDVIALYIPLKKGTEGAFFLIIKSTLTNDDIFQKALPLLKSFTEFDIPKELFQSENFNVLPEYRFMMK